MKKIETNIKYIDFKQREEVSYYDWVMTLPDTYEDENPDNWVEVRLEENTQFNSDDIPF